ncbi:MAG: ATP-binding cassette domain-containing protein [Bacteroidales bacterium]|jgi:ABC-type multidrug transport system ATPase subunit|nr:ATP-binding cassette domain-containing protein [Bacteroidales bacterium]
MSEQILKALMQLFAIIAHPSSDAKERRSIVEYFLKRQLNQETVKTYLKVFDDYYTIHQQKLSEKSKRKKRTASSSVRVLKICTQINEELTQRQKQVVLVQLLEFVKSGREITDQEMAFVTTVADSFHIQQDEYQEIEDYVFFGFDRIPDTKKLLIIDNNKNFSHEKVFHMEHPSLEGQLRVLEVSSANMYYIKYIGESELYLNGQLLEQERVYVLNNGASIRNPKMHPIYYGDIISQFNIDRIKTRILFEAKGIKYRFKSGAIGLHTLNFSEESGHLVGIMGASGAGKSTLLNVLNGSSPPTEGKVLINGINIHTEKDEIEGLIGHVSQDDLLIEELTVYQNLYYNAKLCFDNYSEEQIQEAVLDVLENLGLYDIRDIEVGTPLNKKISGGQRKRLNIALELIREPAVLFLDEPTSGLSSRDSENILDLLKELTLKGKLVFVVIHQPSSDIFKMFDKLLILDNGGYLIYDGDPIDSIIYFKSSIQHANWSESECHCCGNVNPEQIFNIIETKVVDEYGNFTNERKISPTEWRENFENEKEKDQSEQTKKMGTISNLPPPQERKVPEILFKTPNRLKQFLVFVKRDVLSKLSNTQYLVINLLEAPLLAFLLAYIIKYYNVNVSNEVGYSLSENSNLPVYIFMAVIVGLFIGLTVSAEEIIKDRKILKREAFLNLSWGSYLFSKIAIQFTLSAIQALMFVIIGNTIMEIKGMYFEYWLVLFSAWCFSNMLGLVISDSFKTVITIYILIPFLIIPQLILSGIIVKFEKLNPNISNPRDIPFYGEIITARWAYEALAVYQFKENDYERQFYPYDKAMSVSDFKKNYWIRTLNNKVTFVERHLNNNEKSEEVKQNLKLLRHELEKELASESGRIVKFNKLNELTLQKIDQETIRELKNYLDILNKYYIQLYNKANSLKDEMISEQQKTPEDRKEFMRLKRENYNDNLAELVKNSNEINRIIEYNGELFQKIDPIFLDPPNKFIKAHFYAPRKQFFGNYYDTFKVNIAVIWFMTILLFIVLYYRLLRRALDFFEEQKFKTKKGKS